MGAVESKPRQVMRLARRFLPTLIQHRYQTMLWMVVFILMLEIVEHLILQFFGARAHRIYDALLYSLFVLALTWLLLNILEQVERERKQAISDMDQQSALSQCLGDARSWDALVECITSFPRQVAPQARVTLFVYHHASSSPRAEVICDWDGQVRLQPADAGITEQFLLLSNFSGHADGLAVKQRTNRAPAAEESTAAAVRPLGLPPHRYNLAITRNNQNLGLLHLEYPTGSTPSPAELRTLKSAAPLIALALESALLQNLAAEQAAASESDRQQIAQNLHDTLAQNISYLRLKLDQLTGENAIREIGVVLQELERMRATADEAYTQVRQILDELGPIQTEDLVSSVGKQARAICDRADLRLRTSQVGAPYALPASLRQQILFIAREALHNIEKHACAQQVHVQFLWLEAELIVKITDNGVGFNPLSLQPDGHYGLWIMQQRAEEMGGTLKITPSDENGTEVTLWVPRPDHQLGHSEKT